MANLFVFGEIHGYEIRVVIFCQTAHFPNIMTLSGVANGGREGHLLPGARLWGAKKQKKRQQFFIPCSRAPDTLATPLMTLHDPTQIYFKYGYFNNMDL